MTTQYLVALIGTLNSPGALTDITRDDTATDFIGMLPDGRGVITSIDAIIDAAIAGIGGAVVPNTRQVLTGTGLEGGGDLSADRTLSLTAGVLTSLGLADTSVQPARLISAGTGLQGGGSLAADRTISLNSATLASLGKADTALQPALIGAANGIAPLGSDAKINASYLPAVAISESFVVANEAAMLALTAQVGDVAIRTDMSNAAFLLGQTPASTLANWLPINQATGAVTSVAGKTGDVTLVVTDVSGLQTALDSKASLSGAAFSGAISAAGMTTTGDLWVIKSNPSIIMQRSADTERVITIYKDAAGINKWFWGMDFASSNHSLRALRRDAAGNSLDSPFTINWDTGAVTVGATTGGEVLLNGTSTRSTTEIIVNPTNAYVKLRPSSGTGGSGVYYEKSDGTSKYRVERSGTTQNFTINHQDDTGAFHSTILNFVDSTKELFLQSTGAAGVITLGRSGGQVSIPSFVGATTFNGNITIQKAFPIFQLRRSANSEPNSIYLSRADGTTNWIISHNGDTDSPANGFSIKRRDSAGAGIDYPLTIAGDTGAVVLGNATTGFTTALGGFKYIRCLALASGTDLDTVTDAAMYTGPGLVNAPFVMGGTTWGYVEVIRFSSDANYCLQRFTSLNSGGVDSQLTVWHRRKYAGTWGLWVPVSGFATPAAFGAQDFSTAALATTASNSAILNWLEYRGPKLLDRWYRLSTAINIDGDVSATQGMQIFGMGAQSGLVLAGGYLSFYDNDVPNPTGNSSQSITLKDINLVKVGYDANVALTLSFKDGDTGSSMPCVDVRNVNVMCATNTDGFSGAAVQLHNVRNSVVDSVSCFGRYGTYNGVGILNTGGNNSASVEVYFNNCRMNHFANGFQVQASSGATANDDMQGIHYSKCTAIAVNRGWDLNGGGEGFGEWFAVDTCHAYYRELGVYTVNCGNVRVKDGYWLSHSNAFATVQGIALTGTSIEPFCTISKNRIRHDASTGATRIGLNLAATLNGVADDNKTTNATNAYGLVAGSFTQRNNV